MNVREIGIIVSLILSLVVIIGGFIFSKYSKSSDEVKKNVSMGAYLLGAVSLIFNGFQLWRVMNGTSTSDGLPSFPSAPTLPSAPSVPERSTHVVEFLGLGINTFNLVNIGAGVTVIIIGLIFKHKKWSKMVILLGVVAIIAGLFQILL